MKILAKRSKNGRPYYQEVARSENGRDLMKVWNRTRDYNTHDYRIFDLDEWDSWECPMIRIMRKSK